MKQNKSILGDKRGVTLIELLIVLSLFIIISSALVGLFAQYNSLFSLGTAQTESVGGARAVLSGVGVYATQGRRVLANLTLTTTTYYSGTTTLAIELPTIDANGAVLPNVFDYALYYQEGVNIYRELASNIASARAPSVKLLASNIESIIFTYDNADFTQVKNISVEVLARASYNRVTATAQEAATFSLRNY